jgi:hypothetical protein
MGGTPSQTVERANPRMAELLAGAQGALRGERSFGANEVRALRGGSGGDGSGHSTISGAAAVAAGDGWGAGLVPIATRESATNCGEVTHHDAGPPRVAGRQPNAVVRYLTVVHGVSANSLATGLPRI